MREESELLIFRRPPSASLAAVGEPYSSAVGLLMEDPKSPPEKGGPGAGDAAGRLKDKRRSRAGLPKMVRRKHLEPGPNLSSFAIPVRLTPLSLLLVRRIWLFTANAFERWHEAVQLRTSSVKTSTSLVLPSKVRFFRLDSPERAAFAP